MTHYAETPYGFEWGAAKIERTVSDEKFGVVVTISTPRGVLHVRITPTGFIRIGEVIKRGKDESVINV